ncbi:MAG: bacterioferritin, partial [Actinomycetota bacterium]|nr:bacterioferritin [Actinomycetota bacterium]
YQEIARWIGDGDPTTRRLMEQILEEEEEHADDLNDLLGN